MQPAYLEHQPTKLVAADPFESLDEQGVGAMIQYVVAQCKAVNRLMQVRLPLLNPTCHFTVRL